MNKESSQSDERDYIAFVGTPNCGKTTIFNALTGLHQKVGNFAGVTVEPTVGTIQENGVTKHIIDLPGVYSFLPKSADEHLTFDVLKGDNKEIPHPKKMVIVLDGSSLEKSLFLFSYCAELNMPAIAVVTMIDEIKARHGIFDDIMLERYLGIPVIPVVGQKGIGFDELRFSLFNDREFTIPQTIVPNDADVSERHKRIREIFEKVITIQSDKVSEKLDTLFLHPIVGPLVFILVLGLFFQSIFSWAEPMMNGLEGIFAGLQELARGAIPAGLFRDFVTDALIAGVGSVLVFIPQILLLNVIIVFLEDCGYLARAAFLIDRLMGLFGLQGRSFIPLLGSFACAIPGIMSARIIPSEKDRMATMLVAPLMTCSARLPVYALLIGVCIPSVTVLGFLNLQAIVLAGLYLLAGLTGLILALIFKKTLFKGSALPFLMEFPPYRIPSVKSLSIVVWNRSKEFVKNAGTVILIFSVILWVLTEFPKADIPTGTSPLEAQRIQLEESYAGSLGKTLQPIFEPIGFDWKTTIGVIGSFAAREVFVSVMGQLYSADISESDMQLREILQKTVPFATCLSILMFYVYALQCISTIAVLKRETGSWKWPAFAFCYTFVLAYIMAFIVYQAATV